MTNQEDSNSKNSNSLTLHDYLVDIRSNFKNHLLFYLLATIISLAAIGGVYLIQKPAYTSKFAIDLKILNGAQAAILVEELRTLRESNDTTTLAALLNADQSLIREIKYIHVAQIPTSKSYPMEVEISTYSNEIMTDLSHRIVEYLNNTPYVQENVEVQRNLNETLLQDIEAEITSMEKQETETADGIGSIRGLRTPIVAPTGSSIILISLKEKKSDLQLKLQQLYGCKLLSAPHKPLRPRKLNFLGFAILSNLLIISYIIVRMVYKKQYQS